MTKSKIFSGLFVTLLFVMVAQSAMAQSTIFNIPSTDTVDKGKGYFEFDFLPQAPGPDTASRTFIYNPRIVVGLPHDAEFGVNFPAFHNSGNSPTTAGYIQPNFKWKFFKNDDAGVALDIGTVINTPINNRSVQGSWAYVYGGVSKKVKTGMYGPRFTVGPYGVIANEDATSGPVSFIGPRGGVLVGYEQPLGSKVSFVADWFSGTKGLGGASASLGYFTPGISITLPGSGLFNAGYSFGNDSWQNSNASKNRYVFLYYGVTF